MALPIRLRPSFSKKATLVAISALVGLVALAVARTRPPGVAESTSVVIAVGDSYAVGYQPHDPTGAMTVHGFVNEVAKLSNPREPAMVLNFACSGATTETVSATLGCTTGPQAVGAPTYTSTQLDAAVRAVSDHAGHVRGIVVALGINDFARCGASPEVAHCIERSAPVIRQRLQVILSRLRRAAGPHVPIIGITYPNIGLIGWRSNPPQVAQAREALDLTVRIAHPAIMAAYRGLGQVADVTAASGGLAPLPDPSSGHQPEVVTQLCRLTWMCRDGDLHLTPAGQHFVAQLIIEQLRHGRR